MVYNPWLDNRGDSFICLDISIMKYTKWDMVEMRVPEKEILDSPLYMRIMIETFKVNPMVKIVWSAERSYWLIYHIEDWKWESRAIREDWIAKNRWPVLFI